MGEREKRTEGPIARLRNTVDRTRQVVFESWDRFSNAERTTAYGALCATALALSSLIETHPSSLISVFIEDVSVVSGTLFAINLLRLGFDQLAVIAGSALMRSSSNLRKE